MTSIINHRIDFIFVFKDFFIHVFCVSERKSVSLYIAGSKLRFHWMIETTQIYRISNSFVLSALLSLLLLFHPHSSKYHKNNKFVCLQVATCAMPKYRHSCQALTRFVSTETYTFKMSNTNSKETERATERATERVKKCDDQLNSTHSQWFQ